MKTKKITHEHFLTMWNEVAKQLGTATDLRDYEDYFCARRDFRRFLSLYLDIEVDRENKNRSNQPEAVTD